ncbi:quinol:cytochrome C oxidoreductase [Flavobacterium sp. ANB]|uniref:quinol:cytochrome C oxidoreductase n=1 Tax=unclassified Flavobacterium TaxID=196869 RepID=UPI0012B980AB|nr:MULTISPECIES: quinol:cytochrome C oxidoreductase [unclassified Flavobacterium]MBF4514709.1 quinol:cytochrome C oxidoreductase [Flavobacterium sp. ANB]MTD68035.1 quinol:cytochrome C oxidoreductase [Flavobacterium sp. LC2016-13]
MYTFSSKLKTFSFILMAVGILGIGYGFLKAPKNIEEVKTLLAKEASEHGGEHGEATAAPHETAEATSHAESSEAVHHEEAAAAHVEAAVNTDSVLSSKDTVIAKEVVKEGQSEETHAAPVVKLEVKGDKHAEVSHEEHDPNAHAEHVLHQLQNKPWSALYVACIFFLLLSMGVLAFYAIQQVAQAGWSPVLFRVMQGITAYLPVASVIFFIILVLCGLHFNHIFVWLEKGITDPNSANYDEIIAGKHGYLNFPFWIVRAGIFLLGWNLYRHYSRKNCLAQDDANDDLNYKKNFKLSAGFLVFFIVSESIMSWDWIMSFDPHWFSTLFGWYVFASFFVSGITTIALVTIYLKSKGYLEYVNTSHIHDLAKFMFGISIFWTYLWFSQFMLIWYANIPEEVTYFITRIQLYNLPFFGAVVMNFVFPLLILVNTDFKRLSWVIVMAGTVILLGHYVDFFNMIMPGTVGDKWFIGIPEISSILFFLGLFIFVVFTALTKAPLLAKRNPFIEESKHFHY